jgi:hypothetical protein
VVLSTDDLGYARKTVTTGVVLIFDATTGEPVS